MIIARLSCLGFLRVCHFLIGSNVSLSNLWHCQFGSSSTNECVFFYECQYQNIFNTKYNILFCLLRTLQLLPLSWLHLAFHHLLQWPSCCPVLMMKMNDLLKMCLAWKLALTLVQYPTYSVVHQHLPKMMDQALFQSWDCSHLPKIRLYQLFFHE